MMSRSRSRSRQRRRRLEAGLREAVAEAREADARAARGVPGTHGHGKLWQLLQDIERSGLCVWDVAKAIECSEDERAMIAQVVAPALAGMTRVSVIRLREEGAA
jgi:hypothetical protein